MQRSFFRWTSNIASRTLNLAARLQGGERYAQSESKGPGSDCPYLFSRYPHAEWLVEYNDRPKKGDGKATAL